MTIENIHVADAARRRSVATAVLRGSNITAVPRLLALLCILSVFIPAFIMGDPLRSLFMPLTLAVGFAMISSYLLSSTFVPIMCVVPAQAHGGGRGEAKGLFDRVQRRVPAAGRAPRPAALAGGPGLPRGLRRWSSGRSAGSSGTELFPQVDSGEFVLRFRPPPGSNFELTRQMAVKCLRGDRARGEAREHRRSRWASSARSPPTSA